MLTLAAFAAVLVIPALRPIRFDVRRAAALESAAWAARRAQRDVIRANAAAYEREAARVRRVLFSAASTYPVR